MELDFEESLYNEGNSIYSRLSSSISTLLSDFESYTENANDVASQDAKVEYTGTYPETLDNIKTSINNLSTYLSTSKSKVDSAKLLIDQYNNNELNVESLIFCLNALNDPSHTFAVGNSPDKVINYSNIYDNDFTPQGITIIGNQVLISAYDSRENSDRSSRIYVYNINDPNDKYTIVLDNTSHVGGVTFDESNNVLLVTGKAGYVNAYNYTEILNLKNKLKATNPENISISLNKNSSAVLNTVLNINSDITEDNKSTTKYDASTVYFDNIDKKIYITDFSSDEYKGHTTVGTMVLKGNTYTLENAQTYEVDGGIQGLSTYHKGDKTYMVESRSFADNESQITVKDITNGMDNQKLIGTKKLGNKYSEGIFIDNSGTATLVHEQGKYVNENDNRATTTVDIDNIIKENNKEPGGIVLSDNAKNDFDIGKENGELYTINESNAYKNSGEKKEI